MLTVRERAAVKMSAAMAALFRRKKHLDVSGAPQKKGRSQSLDPTSLAYLSLKQVGGSSDKKGQTIERLAVPEINEGQPAASLSSSPNRGHSPNRRASDLFEGGLRQFQQLYKRRGSREPDPAEDGSSKSLQVPKPRQRSGSVDVGRLNVTSARRGSTEGSRSLPQQGRRGSVDPGLRLYTALRSNGVRRGSVDANVKQFQAVYQQRKALKSEQAALYAASSGSTSPVPVSIPESPEITSRYHKPRPGTAAAAAAAAAAAELDAAQREMVRRRRSRLGRRVGGLDRTRPANRFG